ncbi:MAG: hypothetical protein ACIAQF_00840 [Phycisphaerales bacterium JB065]
MSQMGMQMPGAQRARKASLNVYTGMSLVAMIALLVATIFVFNAARTVAPSADALGVLKLHEPGKMIQNKDLPNATKD